MPPRPHLGRMLSVLAILERPHIFIDDGVMLVQFLEIDGAFPRALLLEGDTHSL